MAPKMLTSAPQEINDNSPEQKVIVDEPFTKPQRAANDGETRGRLGYRRE